jgi:hypothetical protein
MLSRILQTMCVLAVTASPLAAANISGTVFNDPRALASRSDFRPLAGVTVALYRDGGDRRADGADDRVVRTTTTATDGSYAFQALDNAFYWIVADSRSISVHGTWPQETYGGAGSFCDDGTGAPRISTKAGPCYGGRNATRSDDAHSLGAASHVAGVSAAIDAPGVDFAFSDNVVTSTADNGQGTLRQFVVNANAAAGVNEMRFVPVAPETASRMTIRLTTPLPELKNNGTAVDGTIYSFINGRMAGTGSYILQSVPTESGAPKPHIALDVEVSGEIGFNFVGAGTLRAIGIRGARTAVRAMSDLFADRVEIAGAAQDGAPADWGIVVSGGNAILRQVTIADRARNGILTEAKGVVDANDVEVTRCATATLTAAVALRSGGSTLTRCEINANGGIGVEIGSTSSTNSADGAARGNVIRSSRIVDNTIGIALHPNASDTVIEYNDIVWNRASAVVAESGGGAHRHRVSMNHFNENGGAVIGIGEQTDVDAAIICTPATLGTIGAPQVSRTSTKGVGGAGEITVEGSSCPGATVEVYTSYITGELRRHSQENPQDLTSVREALRHDAVESRDAGGLTAMRLPSVGEFNFAGTAVADASGRFTVTVPWPRQAGASLQGDLRAGALSVAAIAIDKDGNTSRFGRRKIVANQ